MAQQQNQKPIGVILSSYIMLEDYLARNNGNTKTFKKGETVLGYPKQVPPNVRAVPGIIVDDYWIPKSIVKEAPKIELDAKDNVIEKTKKVVKTSSFKQGAVIGITLGAGYGFFNNKNIFYSAIMGMIAGGAIGHFFFKGQKEVTESSSTSSK